MEEHGTISRTFMFFLAIPFGFLIFCFQKFCWVWVKMCFYNPSWGIKIQMFWFLGIIPTLPYVIYENAQKREQPELFVSYILGIIFWYYMEKNHWKR